MVGRDPVRLWDTNAVDNVVPLLIPPTLIFLLPVGSAFSEGLDGVELDVFEDDGLVAAVGGHFIFLLDHNNLLILESLAAIGPEGGSAAIHNPQLFDLPQEVLDVVAVGLFRLAFEERFLLHIGEIIVGVLNFGIFVFFAGEEFDGAGPAGIGRPGLVLPSGLLASC